MSKKTRAFEFFLLIMFGLTSAVFSSSQTLTKCKVRSKQLPALQRTPFRLAGTVLSKSTVEYHLRIQTDLNVEIRPTTTGQVKLDIYSLEPPKVEKKNVVGSWSGKFSRDKEYVLALNNCSGKTSARFKLEITWR